MKSIIITLLFGLLLTSCRDNGSTNRDNTLPGIEFDPGILTLEDFNINEVSGQVIYLPVYSNVPYQIDTVLFDMSCFVAIHNTDLHFSINLTSVLYFNQKGELVDDFLEGKHIQIGPLATNNYYIPYEDKSGTGANFLVEWVSDTLVSPPLVESVTICLKPNNTVAVLSQGKVIRERP